MLHGRATEQSVVDRLLAGARVGRGGVLVIHGDAGIGKTALLDYAACSAGGVTASGDALSGGATPGAVAPPGMVGMRVLRGAGVQSEAELPFAGLHLLLGSALARRLALPPPQRAALDAALGLRRAGCYDRFLIGFAVLSLLAGLAEDGPVVCLVDDAHSLDRASAGALVFAARRLDADGVAVIFAVRDYDAPFLARACPFWGWGGWMRPRRPRCSVSMGLGWPRRSAAGYWRRRGVTRWVLSSCPRRTVTAGLPLLGWAVSGLC